MGDGLRFRVSVQLFEHARHSLTGRGVKLLYCVLAIFFILFSQLKTNDLADLYRQSELFETQSNSGLQLSLVPDPDSDPDPEIFVIEPQDANKKLIF